MKKKSVRPPWVIMMVAGLYLKVAEAGNVVVLNVVVNQYLQLFGRVAALSYFF